MNKVNLKIKVETREEIKKMRCMRCFGTGLIKREMQFICENCINNINNCYKCENINKTIWIDCVKCLGSGEIEHKSSQNILKHKYINGYCRKSI